MRESQGDTVSARPSDVELTAAAERALTPLLGPVRVSALAAPRPHLDPVRAAGTPPWQPVLQHRLAVAEPRAAGVPALADLLSEVRTALRLAWGEQPRLLAPASRRDEAAGP